MNGGDVEGINPHACAACMLQRKRCDESCEFAPYFPASRYDEFLNAYNLFGLSNIVRIINSVAPHYRQTAAESILVEGNVRKHDPVHGSLGIIQNLQFLMGYYGSELEAVSQQLAFFKGNQQPPLQPVHDLLSHRLSFEEAATIESFETHPTDQIMDLNQNENENTSVPSDTEGEQQSGKPDEEAKNVEPDDLTEETKDLSIYK